MSERERERRYNCAPLDLERLRQSAEKVDENAAVGLPCAAWQKGIQLWAADTIEELQARARIAAERERELVELLIEYREQARNADGTVTMPVCPSRSLHDNMLEALATHNTEGEGGE